MTKISLTNQNSISSKKLLFLRLTFVTALGLFFIGIYLPMLTISKFFVVNHSLSVVSGIVELFNSGQFILFGLVAGFSLVFPLLKFYMLFKLIFIKQSHSHITKRYLQLMHEYGRWAMLDVLVVAMLIVTVKLGAIVSIKVHVGLFMFGSAVLLIMLLTREIVRLNKLAN